MRWWCSALEETWTWAPKPYIGVWVLCLSFIGLYFRSWQKYRADHPEVAFNRRQIWQFLFGIVGLWLASDWPVGALGGGYLASVHMLQYIMYTMWAAPLLMLGMPDWMFERLLNRFRLDGLWQTFSKPLVAGITVNVLLLATHAPVTVDFTRSSQIGSFVLDMVWLVAGFIAWAPVINPIFRLRMPDGGLKLVYIFAAMALVPMVPGGFLVFASSPLYSTYELAPPIGALSSLDDQQMAGAVMKLANIPITWIVMGVLWNRWYTNERGDVDQHRHERMQRELAKHQS